MEKDKEWISAAEAIRLLKPVLGELAAQRTVCKRAHAGLIRARYDEFTIDSQERTDEELPKEFWWAEGGEALTQNWASGDFDTWINHQHHWRAFGVTFRRADIEKLVPATTLAPTTVQPTANAVPAIGEEDRTDQMRWALSGLKYLRDARSSMHDDLNELMNELRDTTRVSRLEQWHTTCKNVIPYLYHYSSDFPGDGKIPGDTYASPQDFAVSFLNTVRSWSKCARNSNRQITAFSSLTK